MSRKTSLILNFRPVLNEFPCSVMLFIIGLPVMQIILFCYAIGHDPKGLKIAVANYELDTSMIQSQS